MKRIPEVYGLLSILCFTFVASYGWGSNIYKLFVNEPMGFGEVLLRIVGIILFPIGMVAGFC